MDREKALVNNLVRTSASRRAFRRANHGQAITELALLAPLIAIMLLGIVELSGAYGAKMDLQAATANGARIGAIEGNGGLNLTTCPDTSGGVITDTVDMDIVRAVLSVHGLDQNNISKIEVYKASPGGGVSSGFSNTYIPPFTHTVGTTTSLVAAVNGHNWPSCQRSAEEPSDSLGVHVSYTYYPLTPLFGRATIAMDDQSINASTPPRTPTPAPSPAFRSASPLRRKITLIPRRITTSSPGALYQARRPTPSTRALMASTAASSAKLPCTLAPVP